MKEKLLAVSPLDGRYHDKITPLRTIASEYGLIRYRYVVELKWLIALVQQGIVSPCDSAVVLPALEQLTHEFTLEDAERVKTIEATTNHDVKAIEYFLQTRFKTEASLTPLIPYIHFGCTSEDINNLAYGLMLKDLRDVLNLLLSPVMETLKTQALHFAPLSMLSRTHGQAATPTTLGKEWANVLHRLQRQVQQLNRTPILGKCNGAVGNYNAHRVSHPEINWPQLSLQFIEQLGLQFNPYTTQIEPHDALADFLHTLSRINTVLIDFCQDTWHYISLNYFSLKKVDNEVGSSTMPHKINPIDFENAEGNLGMANALALHLATKLPVSRLQRDLSDSTVLRNMGSVAGYSVLAYQSLSKGLHKLKANETQITTDLQQHWEVLAEPIQTVLRAHGIADAYEQLKDFTRGERITQEAIADFIHALDIPDQSKARLLALTPGNYTGLAATLAKEV